MQRLLILSVLFFTLLLITSCEKTSPPESAESEMKVPDAVGIHEVDDSIPYGPVRDTNIHGNTSKKKELTVVVPDNVKGQWASVVLNINDKEKGTTSELTINLGEKKQIPDSQLVIVVGDFLPDFSLSGRERIVTSVSNKPNNPAVGVKILDGVNQIYPEPGKNWAWLYKNFPKMHAFTHERFEVSLKEGVPKK
jgi:hypothetical protein